MRFGCCADPEAGDILAEAGYDYIELSVSRHLQPEMDQGEWSDVRRGLKAQPLTAEAFNTFLPADLKVTGPTVDPERISRYLGVAFQRAAEVGGRLVVFGSGGARTVPEGFPRERAWRQLVDFVRQAGDEAARTGLTLAIEPLNRGESNVLNDVSEAVQLAQAADHPEVTVLADLYHIVREGEPLEHVVEASTWISHVHVADTSRRPPGQGTYPYPLFVSALQQIGYDQRCSVECRWRDLPTECGPALEYLRAMWSRP
jgi:sugar phosphate isomerase/epimerase